MDYRQMSSVRREGKNGRGWRRKRMIFQIVPVHVFPSGLENSLKLCRRVDCKWWCTSEQMTVFNIAVSVHVSL